MFPRFARTPRGGWALRPPLACSGRPLLLRLLGVRLEVALAAGCVYTEHHLQ
jgi:hypothetical protein